MSTIRDRIKELRRVRAGDLSPNPRNWRTHPAGQVEAMQGLLSEIGYADALLARELPDGTLELIDGHMRQALDDEQIVPVLVLDLDENEAHKMLVTLDPLAAMAETNQDALGQMLADIATESDAVQAMLDGLAASAGVFDADEIAPPELASGDRDPFQQMTFTLADSQVLRVKEAMAKAKDAGDWVDAGNENSNGNALAAIAEAYLGAS
jgi:hypothetical protein